MARWLIATLGGQPQVVTLTLDLLHRRGERIDEVIAVFPGGNARYKAAHRRLREVFQQPPYRSWGIRYRARSIDAPDGRPLQDIQNTVDADRAWLVLRTLIGEAKQQGHRLHISLSGGRRALALMTFSAAMLYCTPGDRLWHIYTPPSVLAKIKDGTQMHVAPEEGVRLLEVPFAPWGAYFPGVKAILGMRPQQVLAWQAQWPGEETAQRCALVWQRLTERQREVLRALIEQPTRKEAARALGVSLSTVDTHREVILRACRLAWPAEQVDLDFVRRAFRGWFLMKGG